MLFTVIEIISNMHCDTMFANHRALNLEGLLGLASQENSMGRTAQRPTLKRARDHPRELRNCAGCPTRHASSVRFIDSKAPIHLASRLFPGSFEHTTSVNSDKAVLRISIFLSATSTRDGLIEGKGFGASFLFLAESTAGAVPNFVSIPPPPQRGKTLVYHKGHNSSMALRRGNLPRRKTLSACI
ncbi:hypothetical protein K458DRAFT_171865 [Lentithecium fluviatile CBS 122367]|uniref:Uncharacterized protein n=1 Tax=Lentithecium fluviatile CBS 122367 TaxID=1168545 RepID=A0A6G1JCN8_9PLEO|nr:hypothetical protein K458DRAFT_171865 [Lentithecium fluviatile CBS 122367]